MRCQPAVEESNQCFERLWRYISASAVSQVSERLWVMEKSARPIEQQTSAFRNAFSKHSSR